MRRGNELILIGMTRCLRLDLALRARVGYSGLRRIRGGVGINVSVINPMLIVLGLGLGVLLRIIVRRTSADHIRWRLGSRTGIGSS